MPDWMRVAQLLACLRVALRVRLACRRPEADRRLGRRRALWQRIRPRGATTRRALVIGVLDLGPAGAPGAGSRGSHSPSPSASHRPGSSPPTRPAARDASSTCVPPLIGWSLSARAPRRGRRHRCRDRRCLADELHAHAGVVPGGVHRQAAHRPAGGTTRRPDQAHRPASGAAVRHRAAARA